MAASKDIFRFFDLPRELRDMIYEHSVADSETGENVAVFNYVRPGSWNPRGQQLRKRLQWLRTCRQMKDEGLSVLQKTMTWDIRYDWQLQLVDSKWLHERIANVRTLILHYSFFESYPLDAELSLQWPEFVFDLVEAIKSFPNLTNLEISFDLCGESAGTLEHVLKRIAEDCQSVKSITITRKPCGGCMRCHCFCRHCKYIKSKPWLLCRRTSWHNPDTCCWCHNRPRNRQFHQNNRRPVDLAVQAAVNEVLAARRPQIS